MFVHFMFVLDTVFILFRITWWLFRITWWLSAPWLSARAACISAASWQNQQCCCAPSEDSDQPGHLPSLIRVFAVRTKKAWVLSYPLSAQRRLWSDWADAQADLSLRWVHSHFVGFVTRWLILCCLNCMCSFPVCCLGQEVKFDCIGSC